jgi:hypothetical protein
MMRKRVGWDGQNAIPGGALQEEEVVKEKKLLR